MHPAHQLMVPDFDEFHEAVSYGTHTSFIRVSHVKLVNKK